MSSATSQLRALSDQDLADQLEDTHRQLFSLRVQVATRQTASHRALRATRRKIARIKTLQHERLMAKYEKQEG